MKVGIDTFGSAHGKSGIGSYLSSLTSQLKNSDKITFELFGLEIDKYTFGAENGLDWASVNIRDSQKVQKLWHISKANHFAKKQNYDVVLYCAGSQFLPLTSSIPSIAVVNDVVSEQYSFSPLQMEGRKIVHSLKNTSKIIVPSQFIRKDLTKLGIPESKIIVIHNGINHSAFYPREMFPANFVDIKPFAIKKPYFIYPSRMCSATKKHIELIKAFNIFKEKTHMEHRLVFSGTEGTITEEIKKEILSSPYASDIFLTGFFPHESFPLLYASAEGCIFPSVNEGIGLPVLEAMATGIPVACSNEGALPEIAGINAIFFDSNNIPEMAQAIERLALDSQLRKKLKASGIEWTKRFDWEKTAQKTVSVIHEVYDFSKKEN